MQCSPVQELTHGGDDPCTDANMSSWKRMSTATSAVKYNACLTSLDQSNAAYTLFEQALVEGSQAAWEKLYIQYSALVISWVQKEASFALSGEEAQQFANRAFAKLWRSITPDKFAKLAGLPSILKYLRLCVRSVVVDEVRREQRICLVLSTVSDTYLFASPDIATEYDEMFQRDKLWAYVQTRLKNQKEVDLMYYRFVLGLKPNRICEQFQDTFATPEEVYALLQNILGRLRRDPALRDWLLS